MALDVISYALSKKYADSLGGTINQDFIKEEIQKYLKDNPVDVDIDDSLSQAGKPADALAVKNLVDTVKTETLTKIGDIPTDKTIKQYIDESVEPKIATDEDIDKLF